MASPKDPATPALIPAVPLIASFTTSLRIITIVVCGIAIDATIGILTLSYCLIAKIEPDPTLITAYVGVTSGLFGALTGLLVNTRTTHTPTNGGGEIDTPGSKK
jgi:hypothetical protein